jgi:two-component sensor histidine kinase
MILNEAITNAIKHAFPGNRPGHIQLSLSRLLSGDMELEIRDNGIGLPAKFRHNRKESLGLTLIKGLVDQLHGSYTIEDDAGVVVTIRFRPSGALLSS